MAMVTFVILRVASLQRCSTYVVANGQELLTDFVLVAKNLPDRSQRRGGCSGPLTQIWQSFGTKGKSQLEPDARVSKRKDHPCGLTNVQPSNVYLRTNVRG